MVKCVGMSSCEVTGSAYLVEAPTGEKVLMDMGIFQRLVLVIMILVSYWLTLE